MRNVNKVFIVDVNPSIASFILTMRNVNVGVISLVLARISKFYINYEECKSFLS